MKYLIMSFVFVAVVSAEHERHAHSYPHTGAFPYPRILHQTYELKPGQSYIWSYDTENGISGNQEGVYHYPGPKGKAILHAKGGYQFTTPDGYLVSVTYTAGPGGYAPRVNIQYQGNRFKPITAIPYSSNPSNLDVSGNKGPFGVPQIKEQTRTPIPSESVYQLAY